MSRVNNKPDVKLDADGFGKANSKADTEYNTSELSEVDNNTNTVCYFWQQK